VTFPNNGKVVNSYDTLAWITATRLRRQDNTELNKHTRGLDLSGSLEGAGGIGGLLARSQRLPVFIQRSSSQQRDVLLRVPLQKGSEMSEMGQRWVRDD
jgi:hypothetical protein